MQKKLIWIIIIFFYAQGTMLNSCHTDTKDAKENKYLAIESLVKGVLDTLSLPKEKDRLFIISQSACSMCFDKAIEAIAQSSIKHKICIAVIGAEIGYIYHLNFIHKREQIDFIFIHQSLSDKLEKLHPIYASSLLMGAIKKEGRVEIFNGFLHLDEEKTMQPDAVLSFLFHGN